MFTLVASLLLAPAFVRADDNLKSACTTIARLVQAYPQFNLTIPSSCNEWLTDDKKECVKLQANLRIGDRGERVRALHTLLVRAGYGPFTSDEFSEKTAEAVVGFQEQYRSEVLAPYGLSRGTGFVGVSTRAKLNALFSCATSTTGTISFLRITSAPSTLKVNEVGTWKLGVTTPYSSNYSVTVTWGDEISTATAITSTNTTTFTHSYSATGTYSVIFRLSSGGQTQTVTHKVHVGTVSSSNSAPSITSISGPSSLSVGTTGTWEMRASDPEGKRLTYSILWGDDAARDTQLVAEIRGASSAQTTNFTHSYSRAGTYTVRITVSDQLGAYAVSTISVVVQ